GLALITAPAYVRRLPGGGAHIDGYLIRSHGALIAAVLAGLVLLLVSPALTRGMAAADEAVARGLLGSGREQLTARIGELETSRAKVMDAAETERMRIERDLHDGAQQRLVSLAMDLGRAKAKFGTDPEAAAAIVSEAHEEAQEALGAGRRARPPGGPRARPGGACWSGEPCPGASPRRCCRTAALTPPCPGWRRC